MGWSTLDIWVKKYISFCFIEQLPLENNKKIIDLIKLKIYKKKLLKDYESK